MRGSSLWLLVFVLGACGTAPSSEKPGGEDAGGPSPPIVDAGEEPPPPPEEPDAGPEEPPLVLPSTCPIGPDAQALLDQIVERATVDALWVAENSGGLHSGFALNLAGADDASYIGAATLAMPCERQLWYDPYCESDDGGAISPGGGEPAPATGFAATHNRCLRLGCGGTGVYLAQVYLTEKPHTDPADRHALTYETTTVPGTAIWDPNPTMTWSMRNVSSSDVRVTGEIDRAMRVLLASGEELDLTHRGTVRTVVRSRALQQLDLTMQFPALTSEVLDLFLDVAPSGEVDGSLMQGEITLATWAGDAHETVRMTWLGACGE